ncbi:MAG: ribosome maturation factor RimP [Clostridiaceae bacterium]|nr:ribosome maturation factor RimP [Clostridiaceae bacterium]
MSKSKIADIVASMAQPIVEEAGCELVDVEYVKEGGSWFLRIYIDKPGGVTLDDCENVSRPLNDLIDEKDPIPHAYYLEVSSPGLERPLKKPRDFEKAVGSLVEIKLYKAADGKKSFVGRLDSFDGDTVSLKTENDEICRFHIEQIAKAKRKIEF